MDTRTKHDTCRNRNKIKHNDCFQQKRTQRVCIFISKLGTSTSADIFRNIGRVCLVVICHSRVFLFLYFRRISGLQGHPTWQMVSKHSSQGHECPPLLQYLFRGSTGVSSATFIYLPLKSVFAIVGWLWLCAVFECVPNAHNPLAIVFDLFEASDASHSL